MKTRVALAFLLSSLCPLCLCGESFALDAETKTPYQLQVVLHFADQRLLTPVFRDRVTRELRDGLQASFGDLVSVEVTTDAAALGDVAQNGLKALDARHERSAVKTHFVLIDYSGVHYEIQARQYDGLTGQPSPRIRQDQTRDPELVARTAALLIEQDFGLVGTFDTWPQPPGKDNEDGPVTLTLKGAGLGVPLGRWIKKGDVFAVVQMSSADGPGRQVPGALLVVDTPPEPDNSACVGHIFHRYDPPRGAAAGFRCFKLGTTSAPLRLRLMQALPDDRIGPLKEALTVEISHKGFGKGDTEVIRKSTDNDGAVNTTGDANGVFDSIAFVKVFSANNKPQALLPVALLDDQPVVIPVHIIDDPKALQAYKRAAWERDVDTAWREQSELFRELNELASQPDKREQAMKMIREGIDRGRQDFVRLSSEGQELAKTGQNSNDAEKRLKEIDKGVDELKQFLAKMEAIDNEEKDPKKKVWRDQAEQGQRLENDMEIDKALALYDQILNAGYLNDKLKEHVDKLHKEWDTKNADLLKARKFIYDKWPTLDDAALKDKLPEANAAVKVCEAAGDWRTLTKFLKATDAHGVRMKQELSELRPDINIADENPAKLIKDLSAGLRPLVEDVQEWLQANAPKGG